MSGEIVDYARLHWNIAQHYRRYRRRVERQTLRELLRSHVDAAGGAAALLPGPQRVGHELFGDKPLQRQPGGVGAFGALALQHAQPRARRERGKSARVAQRR